MSFIASSKEYLMSEPNKRNTVIDYAKGLAIVLMLADHIIKTGSFITSFHMPLFIILSGYFFKDVPFKEYLLKKVKGLLIPYVILNIIALIFVLIRDRNNFVLMDFISKIKRILLGCDGLSLGWFLIALFVASIIYWVIYKISWNNKLLYGAILIVLVVAGWYFGPKDSNHFYQWDVALICVAFFAVGHLYKVYAKEVPLWTRIIILLLALGIWTVDIMNGGIVLSLRIYHLFPLCVIGAIAGTYVVLKACKYLDRIPVINTYFRFMGRNTLLVMYMGNVTVTVYDWNALGDNILVLIILQVVLFSVIIWLYRLLESLVLKRFRRKSI